MSDGMSKFEQKIVEFEQVLSDLQVATTEAHAVLKDIRKERREIERMMTTDTKKMVMERTEEIVKTELDKIGPTIRKETGKIYDRVSHEVEKLIDLCLGKEFSVRKGREDLRPELALKLREWIMEIIEEKDEITTQRN